MTQCPSLNASSDDIDANLFVKNLTHGFDQLKVVQDIMK